MFPAGCVGVYSDAQVNVFAGISLKANPWLDDAAVTQQGSIFVWDIDETGPNPPSHWLARFPNAEILEPFECPAGGLASDRMAKVGMVFVRPTRAITRSAKSPPVGTRWN